MTHSERTKRNEQIRDAIAAGESIAAVATRFGVSARVVREECPDAYARQVAAKGPIRLSLEQYRQHHADVVQLAEAGMYEAKIAETLKVSRQRVRQILKRAEIPVEPYRPERADAQAMAVAVSGGMSRKDVAVQYKRSIQTVNNACRLYGVTRKSGTMTMRIAAYLLTHRTTQSRLADDLGVSHAIVNATAQRLRAMGFTKYIKARDGRLR